MDGIGERIREARETAVYGRSELARKIGISVNALWQIETGRKRPKPATIRAIADALGIPLHHLAPPGSHMGRDEMGAKIAEEIGYLPRGDYRQNIFRAAYNALREHQLSQSASSPAIEALREATRIVQNTYPEFQPAYDQTFFEGREEQ